MNWLSIVLAVLILGVAVVQALRGFGRAAGDALGLYAALFLAGWLSEPLAGAVHFHSGAAINHSYAFVLLFLVLGGLSLGLSRYIYHLTPISAGMFDRVLGFVCGLAAGMIVAHSLVSGMVMADPSGRQETALVTNGFVSNEMLDFPTYHSVLESLTGTTAYHRELSNVGG